MTSKYPKIESWGLKMAAKEGSKLVSSVARIGIVKSSNKAQEGAGLD